MQIERLTLSPTVTLLSKEIVADIDNDDLDKYNDILSLRLLYVIIMIFISVFLIFFVIAVVVVLVLGILMLFC